jgi:hypothetical protein
MPRVNKKGPPMMMIKDAKGREWLMNFEKYGEDWLWNARCRSVGVNSEQGGFFASKAEAEADALRTITSEGFLRNQLDLDQ